MLSRIFALLWGFHAGTIERWQDALPMHLCDWATFVVIFALLTGGQRSYETAYFWGLAGTLQAVLTPDLNQQFPSPLFFTFFISHCGIIAGVLFLTWGLHRQPALGAVFRTWLWTQLYAVCAGVVNWLCGTNFGYLAAKPRHASLLDALAPWPWYVFELEGMAFVLYFILYIPFFFARKRPNGRLAPGSLSPLAS